MAKIFPQTLNNSQTTLAIFLMNGRHDNTTFQYVLFFIPTPDKIATNFFNLHGVFSETIEAVCNDLIFWHIVTCTRWQRNQANVQQWLVLLSFSCQNLKNRALLQTVFTAVLKHCGCGRVLAPSWIKSINNLLSWRKNLSDRGNMISITCGFKTI